MRTAQIESDLSAFPLPPLPAKPLPRNEFAYIMEDDLEQSAQYYRWLKRHILHYHADRRNYSPRYVLRRCSGGRISLINLW
jgi:hypothetical protein